MARNKGPITDDETDHIKPVRAVVYDHGELIPPEELDDALEAAGVSVSVGDDGTPEYSDVPPSLSLSACHLAVELRKDPAEIVADPGRAVDDNRAYDPTDGGE